MKQTKRELRGYVPIPEILEIHLTIPSNPNRKVPTSFQYGPAGENNRTTLKFKICNQILLVAI